MTTKSDRNELKDVAWGGNLNLCNPAYPREAWMESGRNKISCNTFNASREWEDQ